MASTIKVDNVQNQPGTNIINKCGTTITVGASSDTVALAAGASQTGFGRTGTVDWDTASIKTGTFSAVSGNGYFVNTAAAISTVNLPAGVAGAIVAVADYTRTFNTYNCTVAPNGAEKIGGVAASLVLTVDGQSATFVYVDGTEGWVNIQETQTSQTGTPPYICATGGTISTSGNDRIHKFTGPGTFTVCRVATCAADNLVSYVIVGGGGGAGNSGGGAGGAGGYREVVSPSSPYTGSPLDGYPTPGNRITVTASSYPIAVGGGGAAQTPSPTVQAGMGSVASFGGIIGATGAGGGGGGQCGATLTAGGSGGGGRANQANSGGAGDTPPTTPAQGTAGGSGGPVNAAGGGGGATAAGSNSSLPNTGGAGGVGATTEIMASPIGYAGGGGGGTDQGAGSGPGTGDGGTATQGGGRGGIGTPPGPSTGFTGDANTGGGAGGGTNGPGNPGTGTGGVGGSGVVIIRYRYQ
jgi:hypothetical protein